MSQLKQLPMLFLIVITMAALAVFVQIDRMQNKTADLRAKAYQQAAKGVRIEAEEMTLSGVSKDSSGTFIQFTQATTNTAPAVGTFSCPPSGSPMGGTAVIDIDLNVSANYHVWVSMMGGGDSANTMWFQLDNLVCSRVGDLAGMPANAWTWVDFQNGDPGNKIPSPIIGTGHHTIKLIGNAAELPISVDRILMTMDASCVPTGNGDACIGVVSTPTPTPTPSPTPIITLAGTPIPTLKKASAAGPTIQTSSLPKATRNVAYSADVVATDPVVSDTLGMTATKLPPGLTLSSCVQTSGLGGTTLTCPVSGTPITRGTYSPQFTVIDAAGNKGMKTIKIQVQ